MRDGVSRVHIRFASQRKPVTTALAGEANDIAFFVFRIATSASQNA